MATGFTWSENCMNNIENWEIPALKTVYMAIFQEVANNNLIRRKLRGFSGLEFHNEEECNQHIKALKEKMSEEELKLVRAFIGTEVDERVTVGEMADQIVRSLSRTYSDFAKNFENKLASNGDNIEVESLHEELEVYEEISKIDEEKLQNEIQICEKKQNVNKIQRQLQQYQNHDNIEEELTLQEELDAIRSELEILQAKKESLTSKRGCLRAKIKIISANSSARSELIQSSKEKVTSWLQQGVSEFRNETEHNKNETSDQAAANEIQNLQNTVSNMLARQTIGSKPLEFNGSSAVAWQNFLLQFRIASEKCKFSAEENLYRLDKSLKGEAREKVELMLMSASDPEKIIAVLEDFYGGPEHIAFELISKAEKHTTVQNIESFQDFNCLVQNILAALEHTNKACVDEYKLLATLMDKLPETYLKEWGMFLRDKNVRAFNANLNLFGEWCKQQNDILHDMAFFKKVKAINTTSNSSPNEAEKSKSSKSKCEVCNEDKRHGLDECSVFKKADTKRKWDLASKTHACFCCLRFHKGPCTKREICNIDNCQKSHHKLLHKKKAQQQESTLCSGTAAEVKTTAILKRLPVCVFGPTSVKKITALLDEGSTTTMLDIKVAKEIGVQGKNEPFCFGWTNGIYRYEADAEKANLIVSDSQQKLKFSLQDVRLVPKLNLPMQNIAYKQLIEKYPYLQESNLQDHEDDQPLMLIGQRHASLITSRQVIDPEENGPILSKTKLGWAVHGPVNVVCNEHNFSCCQVSNEQLQQLLKQQYSLESFGVCTPKDDKTKSAEDRRAIEIAQNSIIKIEGKFQVKLPWREDNVILPESKSMAIQRLNCLERKLLKNNHMAKAYQNEVEKLFKNGYARELRIEDIKNSTKVWFLPHFPVYNPNKPGKVRLVFDAAAKCNDVSLNDRLLSGPDWLTSIVGILMRFRLHPIAFAGDIKEMFNQVFIDEEDAAAQCFLWRNLNKNVEPKIFQMRAMLFGTCSSPFLAQFVKNYNAELFKNTEPEAVNAIVNDHYVDDYLSGAETVEEAVRNILSVIKIHQNAGFKIQRFISNSTEVLKRLPIQVVSEKTNIKIGNNSAEQQKILGVLWDAEKDVFKFSKRTMHQIDDKILNGTQPPTKRKVLATVSSVYDPVGFVTPITIRGRLLMREVWESSIHWDDEIKHDQLTKWLQWLNELSELEKLHIRRVYTDKNKVAHRRELHIFCDASSQAYAAVVYLRWCYIKDGKEHFEMAMVTSKSRVAPLKHTTIPKLETLAAVVGCRLARLVQDELRIDIDQRYFWTDSKTVHTWIQSDKKLQIFVANRISEICELSERAEWQWISTVHNAADVLTRGKAVAKDLLTWFSGPEFLKKSNAEWPKQPVKQDDIEEIFMLAEEYSNSLNIIKEAASTWEKAVRILAWVKRFIYNSNSKIPKEEKYRSHLNVSELEWAKKMLCKTIQRECFPNDLIFLKHGKRSANLRLTKYDVFLDVDDIMRLSGRIERAKDIAYCTKNPIILDGTHYFTKLIIDGIHRAANHMGTQVVVHRFKTEYWMPKTTNYIKMRLRECLWCKRHRSKPIQPLMGLLPKARFETFEKPFKSTGVDYFGPFYVRDKRGTSGRYNKSLRARYGVIFTCLTTRAIHVEVAHSLSTDSCIMALRRMMTRRGNITTLWSDNGTNFRGAARELIEALEEMDENHFKSELARSGIEWKFIPAYAPNFGGCWERMVGCFKRAIESVLCIDRNPTDEMLLTIFSEAEHLVNTRPYVLESDDPNDELSLCPNDILIQQGTSVYCPGKFSHYQPTEKRMWRIVQALVERFWHRLLKEYIPTLINRSKWHKGVENVREGDVVVLKTNGVHRGDWPLGVVVKVYPGEDGVVRVVDVKTSKNTYRRPASGLCRLNVHRDCEDRADKE